MTPPDLTLSPWCEKLDAARMRRPIRERPKISTTIRLDQDVIKDLRREGPGWQSRINAALREWLRSKT
ncbi:BrnA antitoxin family protein [Rhizobium sp. AAP43]|uniref:BrnA antitoxin family protein n=1 Tax=Rhizobium sp. AAP43 TaxID=1523420 RepID=UPI0006B8D5AD|nr:BrnA antitoxin family protein [Rhizobium sp. AAP43]KPF46946.1 hypothetical protein IP76_03560 [Rhizobium sp. AAP43]